MIEVVQLGNYGFKIVVNVKDPAGAARDLTGASALKIKLKSVLATAGKTFTASFEGAPTTGALSYVVVANDIDALGTWKAQAYYELGSWKGHTQPVDIFYVEGNLA